MFNARPSWIATRRTFIARAGSIAPVVAAHKIAAWPAKDRAMQIFEQSECICTHAANVVARHQRYGANLARTFGHVDAELGMICSMCWRETESETHKLFTVDSRRS